MSNEKKKFNWKAVTQHHLFLPIVCLLVVLLVNVIKTPDFLWRIWESSQWLQR